MDRTGPRSLEIWQPSVFYAQASGLIAILAPSTHRFSVEAYVRVSRRQSLMRSGRIEKVRQPNE